MTPLISIVTTVYKTEEYLDRCLYSLCTQSARNIEIIVVNNGSGSECTKILDKYEKEFSDIRFKLINLKENIGLFHARLVGAESSSGQYLAFVDSDDRISIDFLRLLVKKAKEQNADMVASSVVLEFEDGSLKTERYNPLSSLNFEYIEGEILEVLLKHAGTAYYWNLVWNKLYRRDLWEKALPLLKSNEREMVMCDDIVFSICLCSQATKLVNEPNAVYYYYKRESANSNGADNFEKIQKIVQDILAVFTFVENLLIQKYGEKYSDNIQNWKNRYYRHWKSYVEGANLLPVEKDSIVSQLRKLVTEETVNLKTEVDQDYILWSSRLDYDDTLESLKRKIASKDISIVSFDVFDTLLLRDCWEPYDLFSLLNKEYARYCNLSTTPEFSRWRSFAEHLLNSKDIATTTLDKIYEKICSLYGVPQDIAEHMKAYEIGLEKKICKTRKIGKELYEYAIALDKKVICVSDMYLPPSVISSMLEKCGYENVNLFSSSQYKSTKIQGDLFKIVAKSLNVQLNQIIHIGDNPKSDVEVPNKLGMCGWYLPRTINKFFNATKIYDWLNIRQDVFLDETVFRNLGTRSIMAMIANKFFDNPYITTENETKFNADPYFIGYFCLGPYVYHACCWIKKVVDQQKYKTIHFLARDGYLFQQAFNTLFPNVNTNYLHLSREALVSLMFKNKGEIAGFSHFLFPLNYSPKRLLKHWRAMLILPYDQAVLLCERNGFVVDRKFQSLEQSDAFFKFCQESLLDDEKILQYRENFRKLFAEIVKDGDCTFDVGYSGRPEFILSTLLGYNVDALYLYSNGDKSFQNSCVGKFAIHEYCDKFISIPHEIIFELLISDVKGSCQSYNITEHGLIPVLQKSKQNFVTQQFIHAVHKGCLDFIKDIEVAPFQEWLKFCKGNDLRYFLDYFIQKAPSEDYGFLNVAYFDDLDIDKEAVSVRRMREDWLKVMPTANSQGALTQASWLYRCPRYLRILYYISSDRRMLKEKIKQKLRNYPIVYNFARTLYRTVAWR